MAAADPDHRWVIVLAGGSGSRLSSVSLQPGGAVVPKQYCSLFGQRSLLGDAVARAQRLAPSEHIVVVVASEHQAHWRSEFDTGVAPRVVVQPRNRGTAAGILLPLLAILEQDPVAEVTLLPADHFVAREGVLAQAMRHAQRIAAASRGLTFLLGIEPDAAETDYGWILPATDHGLWSSVAAFVEKPDASTAAILQSRGAVWNSFLVMAVGASLLQLYADQQPGLLASFRQARPHADARRARRLYDRLAPIDFARDVLQGCESRLGLRVAPACGWTDLGTPARVRACAEAHPLRAAQRRPRSRGSPLVALAANVGVRMPQEPVVDDRQMATAAALGP